MTAASQHLAAAAYLDLLVQAQAAVDAAIEHRNQLAAERPTGVTVEQVAEALHISRRHVYNLLR